MRPLWRSAAAPFALVLLAFTGLSSLAVAQQTGFSVTSGAPPAADICNSSSTVTCTTYSFTFTTSASSSDNITWALGSGSFPQGLNLGSKTGILSGNITNTSQSNTAFFLSASDSSTESYTSTPFYTFTVNQQPAITTTALPVGTLGHAYPATPLTATGGTLPYTWSVVNNSLPAGFTLSSGGVLSAANGPAASGTFYLIVAMTDSAGSAGNGATSVTTTIPLTVLPQLAVTSSAALVPAEVNVPYSFTFTASGGTPPYSWSLNSGSRLPTGLILSSSGVLSGTPTTASSGSSFGVTVVDSGSGNAAQAASQTATLVVNPLPTVVTTSFPSGMVGASYSAAASGQGGSTPYNWSLASGSLPPGLTLNPTTGAITGTPVGPAGTATFAIKLTDAASQSATQSLSILINPATLTITTTTLPAGIVGAAYSASITAQGGTAPYTNWSISAGSLPSGLTLNASTGAITGTPTTTGTSTFTVSLIDSGKPAQIATQSLSILINPATLTITTTTLPAGTVGAAYSATVTAQGGTAPYSNWFITAGSLPAGLTLNSSTGAITGTPTTAGASSFTVKLTDSGNPAQSATQALSILVNAAALTITTTTLPAGKVGVAYSASITAQGGTLPYNNWSISAGSLPPGLTINATTGAITGTPTGNAGSFSFTVKLTDSGNPAQTATQLLYILLNPATLTITTTALPSGMVGSFYSVTIAAQGGTAPYSSWVISPGSLPSGLTLNVTSGTISIIRGTPTAAGTSAFTLTVTDGGNPAQTATQSLSILINPATLTITTAALSSGTVGSTYSASLAAQGGTAPYSNWAVSSGSLPTGLTLNASTGTITGTPTTAGTSAFTVKLTDSGNPAQTATQSLSIAISPATLTITTVSLPSGTVASAYSAVLAAQGGTTPYANWSLSSGSLPAGLTLNASTGTITGTPTTAGSSTITVKLTDSGNPAQTATQSLSILISPPGFTITTTTLSAGTVGTAYSASVIAQGGTPPYLNWSISSGSLPQGLTLNASSGAISGTLTAAGTSQFSIKVADSSVPAQTATQSLSITIAPAALTLTPTTLANGSVGTAYSAQLNAQGGTSPYASWTLSSGSLPSGLSLNPANGVISGTPTTTGTSTFTVKVTDSGSPPQTASQIFTITVFAGVTITTTVLPNGAQGLTYSATLTAQSGTAPYTWSITTGTLPAGLVLNSQTGAISGMPTVNGTFTFTVKVADSSTPTPQSATQPLSLFITPPVTPPILPTFTLSGIPSTPTAGTNITNGTVVLNQPSSAAYTGTLSVTLSPSEPNLPAGYLGDAGFVDSSGNKSSTATLLVPALSSSVPLPTIDPGTVAGTLTVSLTVAGQVVASATLTVAASAPVIEANSVQIVNVTSGGFEVELVATSTTRQLNLATFTFIAASGSQISGTSTFNVDVSSLLAGWYSSNSGLTYGGAFSLTIPFTLSGSASAIQSVSVTLTNSVGTSAAVSGTQ